MKKIEGAVALVTGASRGIGRALTEALLARGARKVYAAARNPEAASDPRLVPLRLDVSDAAQVRAAAAAAGDVQILFNNAGVLLPGGMGDASILEQARREMEVNYLGPLHLLHCFAPVLGRGGLVVNIGSTAGLSSVALMPTYSASKAALHSLTQAARVLLRGTRVVGVYPGPVDTDMVRGVPMPKTPPREVASAILDGIGAGQEDIYPDPFAVEFGRRFNTSPKAAERQMAEVVAALQGGNHE